MAQLKPVHEWDEDFVAQLPSGELDWLEFKASEKFNATNWLGDISKYLSAWANYEGGYIIFGVRDPQEGMPLMIDGGVSQSAKPNLATWLDQTLPGLVEHRLSAIETWLIPPKAQNSRIHTGNVLVVIHIPESELAPHQASDHKYYQRVGRNLEPLKHRAVMDILGRRRHPQVTSRVSLQRVDMLKEFEIHGNEAQNLSHRLFWRLKNVGPIMAREWKVCIRIPAYLEGSWVTTRDEPGMIVDDDASGLWFLEVREARGMRPPLFPGDAVYDHIKLSGARHEPPLPASTEKIVVKVFADDMPFLSEEISVEDALANSLTD